VACAVAAGRAEVARRLTQQPGNGRAAIAGLLREAARDFRATRSERIGKHNAGLD
jgi:hypothetical protein